MSNHGIKPWCDIGKRARVSRNSNSHSPVDTEGWIVGVSHGYAQITKVAFVPDGADRPEYIPVGWYQLLEEQPEDIEERLAEVKQYARKLTGVSTGEEVSMVELRDGVMRVYAKTPAWWARPFVAVGNWWDDNIGIPWPLVAMCIGFVMVAVLSIAKVNERNLDKEISTDQYKALANYHTETWWEYYEDGKITCREWNEIFAQRSADQHQRHKEHLQERADAYTEKLLERARMAGSVQLPAGARAYVDKDGVLRDAFTHKEIEDAE